MSSVHNFAAPHMIAAHAPVDARTAFIQRTYLHPLVRFSPLQP